MIQFEVARVAVGAPVAGLFDYQVPAEMPVVAGSRVRVPFGRRDVIGVVMALAPTGGVGGALKNILELLDPVPLLGQDHLEFLTWVSAYYHYPIGEVVAAALPLRLRKARQVLPESEPVWRMTEAARQGGAAIAPRAPRQSELIEWLATRPGAAASLSELRRSWPGSGATLRRLEARGWLERQLGPGTPDIVRCDQTWPQLNAAQAMAVSQVAQDLDRFSVTLLDGVTGSGKTEVYLQLAARVLDAGRSVMVMVPEISLTPQLLQRFEGRLGSTVKVLHSGLAESQRERTWQRLRTGLSRVLLGTRSAVFTPVAGLGLVVVDEEHDPSYKQTEGLRYSARDLAIVRGQRANCPVLLGSATPSLETLRNAISGRYRLSLLRERAGGARQPNIELLNVRDQPLQSGISAPLLRRITETLDLGEQVLLFLNRRGYAPVLTCFSCGWLSDCPRCDARQTLHKASGLLCCHHCGAQRRVPSLCPQCGADDLQPLGQGTEQLEDYLAQRFPTYPLIRIDRDATARKGGLEQLLDSLHGLDAALLVGTQMLAKGHDFPSVTLVGVVDADGGLYSADFRSTERMAQLLIQVAGRAGRGERPGTVLIQTRYPQHPLLQTLVKHGYQAFAEQALAEREAASMPPYSHQALLRAEAASLDRAQDFLGALMAWASRSAGPAVDLWGPVPAPMTRRAGRYRAHLLLQSRTRDPLHRLLRELPVHAAGLAESKGVRWSLDVDPIDLY